VNRDRLAPAADALRERALEAPDGRAHHESGSRDDLVERRVERRQERGVLAAECEAEADPLRARRGGACRGGRGCGGVRRGARRGILRRAHESWFRKS